MYKHYLITRFNIIQEGFNIPADKDGNIVHSESWLSRRFDLFETYTIPSIENQTCDDFTWIVLFDTNTPAKYKKLIDSYRQRLPMFTPLYLDAFVNLNEHVSDYIRKTSSKEYVITSRIDNDDMIHRNYIKRVQELFTPTDNVFISFRSGLQYMVATKTLLRFNYIKNHYTSRIERLTTAETVIRNHTRIHKIGKLQVYSDDYMWVEIVHGGNVSNQAGLYPAINIANCAEIYGRDLEQKPACYFSPKYILGLINLALKTLKESIKYR